MMNITGAVSRFCEGATRRSFLRIGGLLLGDLALAEILRADDPNNRTHSHKSIIMVYLAGGISHLDSFDLKPNAPKEVRGEFHPIDTNVPGIQICELLPNLAAIADKYTLIRSIVGLRDEHSSFQTNTGYVQDETERDGHPNFGSIVSRVQGSTTPVVPPFIDLSPTMRHRPYNSAGPGRLGPTFAGVKADGEDLVAMKLRYVSPQWLGDRRQLRDTLDGFRRAADNHQMLAVDSAYDRAYDVLTSSQLVDALDVEREDPRIRERYGKTSAEHQSDGAPLYNDHLLQARRLVEAGVRCVTVAYGYWDYHRNSFRRMRGNMPMFDQGIAALVQDIHDRGLDRDVTVIVWGEFGRTPKINDKQGGRDHWPKVNGALLAGGGMRTGQVIGSTDALADSAKDRPIPYQDVLATLYQNLGIDPHSLIRDNFDRPAPILPGTTQIIRELF